MTKIHGAFERIPDPKMAEAASDWLLTEGYKFETLPYVHEQYGGEGNFFPPVPSYTTAVVVSYVEQNPHGPDIRTKAINMFPEMTPDEVVGTKYREHLADTQDRTEIIEAIFKAIPEFDYSLEGMKSWCLQRTMKEGLKVVAAHQTAYVPADRGTIDALVFPKCVMQDLPLVIRNQAVKISPQLRELADSEAFPSIRREHLDQGLGPLLRGDAVIANLAGAAAALILPPYQKIYPTPINAASDQSDEPQIKEDRAARRRREREEGKKKKR